MSIERRIQRGIDVGIVTSKEVDENS